MEIVTKRFLLRDFIDSDRTPFLEYQADPRNLTFYTPAESSPDRSAHLFELFQAWAREYPRRNYQLAIVPQQAPQTLLGCCGLRELAGKSGEMELGIERSLGFPSLVVTIGSIYTLFRLWQIWQGYQLIQAVPENSLISGLLGLLGLFWFSNTIFLLTVGWPSIWSKN